MRLIILVLSFFLLIPMAQTTGQTIDYSQYIHKVTDILFDGPNSINPVKIEIAHDRLYLLNEGYGLVIQDISTIPEEAVLPEFIWGGSGTTSFAIQDDLLCMCTLNELSFYDIAGSGPPQLLSTLPWADSAWDVFFNGDHIYVFSRDETTEGLKILDIQDPENPQVVRSIDGLFGRRFARHGDFLYTLNNGVLVLDISTEEYPQLAGYWPGVVNGYYPRNLAYHDQYLYLPTWTEDLLVLDVSNPEAMEVVHIWDNGDYADGLSVEVVGQTLLLGTDYQSIISFDISSPAEPVFTGEAGTERAFDMAVQGDHLFLATNYDEVPVYSLGNGSFMNMYRKVSLDEGVIQVADLGTGKLAVLGTTTRLLVVDHGDWQNPETVFEVVLPGNLVELVVCRNLVLASMEEQGLWVWDFSDPTDPISLGAHPEVLSGNLLFAYGNRIYVSGEGKLWILDGASGLMPGVVSQLDLALEPAPSPVNGGLVGDDRRVCVTNYTELQVVDVTDQAHPNPGPVVEHGWYCLIYDLDLRGDLLYLTDHGFTPVFDVSLTGAPLVETIYPTGNVSVWDGEYIYFQKHEGGIQLFQEESLFNWSRQGQFDSSYLAGFGLAISGDHVVAGNNDGFLVAPKHGTSLSFVDDNPVPEMPSPELRPRILGCCPNPFNPRVMIRFSLPQSQNIEIQVYDVAGKLVRILARQQYPAGEHVLEWDGENAWGWAAPSGVYFARLVASGMASTQRMTLVR